MTTRSTISVQEFHQLVQESLLQESTTQSSFGPTMLTMFTRREDARSTPDLSTATSRLRSLFSRSTPQLSPPSFHPLSPASPLGIPRHSADISSERSTTSPTSRFSASTNSTSRSRRHLAAPCPPPMCPLPVPPIQVTPSGKCENYAGSLPSPPPTPTPPPGPSLDDDDIPSPTTPTKRTVHGTRSILKIRPPGSISSPVASPTSIRSTKPWNSLPPLSIPAISSPTATTPTTPTNTITPTATTSPPGSNAHSRRIRTRSSTATNLSSIESVDEQESEPDSDQDEAEQPKHPGDASPVPTVAANHDSGVTELGVRDGESDLPAINGGKTRLRASRGVITCVPSPSSSIGARATDTTVPATNDIDATSSTQTPTLTLTHQRPRSSTIATSSTISSVGEVLPEDGYIANGDLGLTLGEGAHADAAHTLTRHRPRSSTVMTYAMTRTLSSVSGDGEGGRDGGVDTTTPYTAPPSTTATYPNTPPSLTRLRSPTLRAYGVAASTQQDVGEPMTRARATRTSMPTLTHRRPRSSTIRTYATALGTCISEGEPDEEGSRDLDGEDRDRPMSPTATLSLGRGVRRKSILRSTPSTPTPSPCPTSTKTPPFITRRRRSLSLTFSLPPSSPTGAGTATGPTRPPRKPFLFLKPSKPSGLLNLKGAVGMSVSNLSSISSVDEREDGYTDDAIEEVLRFPTSYNPSNPSSNAPTSTARLEVAVERAEAGDVACDFLGQIGGDDDDDGAFGAFANLSGGRRAKRAYSGRWEGGVPPVPPLPPSFSPHSHPHSVSMSTTTTSMRSMRSSLPSHTSSVSSSSVTRSVSSFNSFGSFGARGNVPVSAAAGSKPRSASQTPIQRKRRTTKKTRPIMRDPQPPPTPPASPARTNGTSTSTSTDGEGTERGEGRRRMDWTLCLPLYTHWGGMRRKSRVGSPVGERMAAGTTTGEVGTEEGEGETERASADGDWTLGLDSGAAVGGVAVVADASKEGSVAQRQTHGESGLRGSVSMVELRPSRSATLAAQGEGEMKTRSLGKAGGKEGMKVLCEDELEREGEVREDTALIDPLGPDSKGEGERVRTPTCVRRNGHGHKSHPSTNSIDFPCGSPGKPLAEVDGTSPAEDEQKQHDKPHATLNFSLPNPFVGSLTLPRTRPKARSSVSLGIPGDYKRPRDRSLMSRARARVAGEGEGERDDRAELLELLEALHVRLRVQEERHRRRAGSGRKYKDEEVYANEGGERCCACRCHVQERAGEDQREGGEGDDTLISPLTYTPRDMQDADVHALFSGVDKDEDEEDEDVFLSYPGSPTHAYSLSFSSLHTHTRTSSPHSQLLGQASTFPTRRAAWQAHATSQRKHGSSTTSPSGSAVFGSGSSGGTEYFSARSRGSPVGVWDW